MLCFVRTVHCEEDSGCSFFALFDEWELLLAVRVCLNGGDMIWAVCVRVTAGCKLSEDGETLTGCYIQTCSAGSCICYLLFETHTQANKPPFPVTDVPGTLPTSAFNNKHT